MTLAVDNIIKLPKLVFRDFLLHLFATILIYFIPNPALLIPVICVLLYQYYKKNNRAYVLLIGVYALCCKSESVYFAYILFFFILFVLDRRKPLHNQERKKIISRFRWFFLYMCMLYLLQLFVDRSVLSLPFFLLTFFSPVLIMFYIWKAEVNRDDVKLFFRHLILIAIAQFCIAFFLQALPKGIFTILARPTLGDSITGTTNLPNSLAFLLTIAILPYTISILVSRTSSRKEKLMVALLFLLFTGMMFLNDAKSLYYSFIIAGGAVFIFKVILVTRSIGRKMFLISFGITLLIALSSFLVKSVTGSIEKYDEYINGKYNFKWQYYLSTFSTDTRPIYQYILGTGPGTNGSRAANALAYDVLYKKENTVTLPKSIPPKSNPFTRDYLSKYFTQEYADASGERSAILGNPFNSICAMFTEFGIVGLFLFFSFLFFIFRKLIKRPDYISLIVLILIIVNLINGFVDQTFEKPLQMYFTYLCIGFSFIHPKPKLAPNTIAAT